MCPTTAPRSRDPRLLSTNCVQGRPGQGRHLSRAMRRALWPRPRLHAHRGRGAQHPMTSRHGSASRRPRRNKPPRRMPAQRRLNVPPKCCRTNFGFNLSDVNAIFSKRATDYGPARSNRARRSRRSSRPTRERLSSAGCLRPITKTSARCTCSSVTMFFIGGSSRWSFAPSCSSRGCSSSSRTSSTR